MNLVEMMLGLRLWLKLFLSFVIKMLVVWMMLMLRKERRMDFESVVVNYCRSALVVVEMLSDDWSRNPRAGGSLGGCRWASFGFGVGSCNRTRR